MKSILKNNYATLDYKDDGIIINDVPIAYDDLRICIAVGCFRMGGRHIW